MKLRVTTLLAMAFLSVGLFAQTTKKLSSETVNNAPAMRWICPEIAKNEGILVSVRSDDPKTYANNVKEKFELYSDPSSPEKKAIVTQAKLTIENPLFSTDNLLNHISTWINTWIKTKGGKVNRMNVDVANKSISSNLSLHIASNKSLFLNKVSISPTIDIKLVEDSNLTITLVVDRYKNDEYGGRDNKYQRTYNPDITDVFPFNTKASHKNTYAKAYVTTYMNFWTFIYDIREELNKNFSKDHQMIKQLQATETKTAAQLRYKHSNDSLKAKYGEPTKVIAEQTSIPNIHDEMRFYENAQKLVFMGKTIAFKEIMSCEIVDDPTFIPGRTTTSGGGLCFWGFVLGGVQTSRTADKTIHNYVVDVRIDNLRIPFIRIATGQDEFKAEEIASVFDYILRRQTTPKQKTNTTRRTKR